MHVSSVDKLHLREAELRIAQTTQGRFIEAVKTTIITALQDTFDNDYPDVQFQNLNVSMEYPATETSYPGIWVKFSFSRLQIVGIGAVFVNSQNQQYKQWSFEGQATLQVFAMTSLERDRISDSLIYMFAFGELNPATSSFRAGISNNTFISMALNSDQLIPGGQEEAVGAPWQPDAIVYNDSYSFNLMGQFASDIQTGQLIAARDFQISPYMQGSPTIPNPFPPDDGNGQWQ